MLALARNICWIMPAAVLGGSVLLQVLTVGQAPVSHAAPVLARVIPRELSGWSTQDLPLGETEETRNAVISTLKFDQYVSRAYQQGSVIVTIYVAYWRPNKVPPRAVGVHTPDTCWVQNGWERLSRAHAVPLSMVDGRALKPAEFGTYRLHGSVQQVYFWHLVGGKPYSYEQEGLHSLTAPLQDMATFGLNQRQDQLFVRLASNVAFDQVWRQPGFDQVLEAFSELGLVLPSPGKL